MVSSIRRCSSKDKDTIWSIFSYAYSVPEASKDRFFERIENTENQFFLIEVDGSPAGITRVLELEQNLRGLLKPMAGIGAVAVSPEYRRLGHIRDLMTSIFSSISNDGYATSTLYPFKDVFYQKLGYVKMPASTILEFNPNSLAEIELPGGYSAKREDGEDMLKVRRALHDAMALETHGAVMRSEKRWEELNKNLTLKTVVARNALNTPEAIMIYSIKGYGEGHSWAETGQIHIVEINWISLEGRDALLNFLYKHADQIMKVTMPIFTKADDYYHWLSDIHTPSLKSNILSMARIIDVEKSLTGFPVDDSGKIVLKVLDPLIKKNNAIFEIFNQDGVLSVTKSNRKPNTTVRIEGLTSILYGTLSESQLRRLRMLEGQTPVELFKWFPRAIPLLTEEF